MPSYNYIKVALIEQNQQSVTTLLNYSADNAPTITDAPTPAVVYDYFLNARECFVQWTTHEANNFALIFRNPYSSDRSGFYMVAISVASGAALTGRETLRALTNLRKTLVEERRMTTNAIDETLADCGIPPTPRSFESWHIAPTYTRPVDAPPCYRTFVSLHELETFFTFPLQEEYGRYSSVIYVAATTSLRPGVELQHVLTPIRNVYSIVTPEGVESSRPSAAGGDRNVLTYTRPGYSPIREAVVAGKPSAFVTYEGARMVVRPASECRLTFTRRVPITVRSSKGGPVTGYTVTVNGRPVDTMQPYIEITDQDLKGDAPVEVIVSSNNFVTEKIEIPADKVNPNNPISVMLNPLELGVTLRLDFGENRLFELQISIEKNTPEYSQLHGGSFHGFRARRLTVPGGGEIYYIDVRSGAKPSAPAFDNVAADVRQSGTKFDRSLPTVDQPSDPTAASLDIEGERRSRRRRSRKRANILGITLGMLIIAGLLAVAVMYLFPAWLNKAETNVAATASTDSVTALVTDTVTDTVAAPAPTSTTPATSPAIANSGDNVYLNTSREWVRDSLRTEQGRALYDALTAGNIEQVVRNPYFLITGAATNQDALGVADLLWASYGASTQRSNERALLKLKDAPSINLHELYETLARYKSPQPNTNPRPKQ